MHTIERFGDPRDHGLGLRHDRLSRQTARALAAVQHHTLVRLAGVQGEGMVQTEKVREIDRLTREAVIGQAFLAKYRDTLAGRDVLLADELRFLTDVARVGKGEIIADTLTTYCRESQR